jgi:hypothetical protein
LVDVEAVDIPGLHRVTRGSPDADRVHPDVGVDPFVSIESNTHSPIQVHCDPAQDQVAGAVETHGEVGLSGQGEVRDLDALCVQGLESATAVPPSDIDRAATLEGLATPDGYGARADRPRGNNGNALTAADGINSGLNGGSIVETIVNNR